MTLSVFQSVTMHLGEHFRYDNFCCNTILRSCHFKEYSSWYGVYIQFRMNTLHLRFKQVQQNMCHSPEVEDGVENNFSLLEPIILDHFFKELLTAIDPKPIKLLT